VFSFWITYIRVTFGTFSVLVSIMRRKRRALRTWCEQTPWTLRWPPAGSPSRWRKTCRQDFLSAKNFCGISAITEFFIEKKNKGMAINGSIAKYGHVQKTRMLIQ
jgi:hypothetical protein